MAASLALLDDGSVWAWGSNADGQLGTGRQDPGSSTAERASLDRQRADGSSPSAGNVVPAVHCCAAPQGSTRPDPFRWLIAFHQMPMTSELLSPHHCWASRVSHLRLVRPCQQLSQSMGFKQPHMFLSQAINHMHSTTILTTH